MSKNWPAILAVVLGALVGIGIADAQVQPLRESNESIANYAGAAALVEHDTNLIAPMCRAVYVNASGTMVFDMAREGTDQSFTVVAGTTLEVRVKRFKTASTATGVCLW